MPELYRCVLNPSGPNYGEWFRIFGGFNVPLLSAYPVKLQSPILLGDSKEAEVYLVDVRRLALVQRARLLGAVALRIGVPIYELQRELREANCGNSFPIRAEDVIVSYEMRAMV